MFRYLWTLDKLDWASFDKQGYKVHKGHRDVRHELRAIFPSDGRHHDFSVAMRGERFRVGHMGKVFYAYKFLYVHGLADDPCLLWTETGNSLAVEYAKLIGDIIREANKDKKPKKKPKKKNKDTNSFEKSYETFKGIGVKSDLYEEFYTIGRIDDREN